MKLIRIPDEKYDEFRLDVIFSAYKWDPIWYDNNTVAKHVLVLTKEEAAEIEKLTEKLSSETINAENILKDNLNLIKPLAIPKRMLKALKKMKNYKEENHIRLMRFDFHPIKQGGYAISEVNSDVPGGFAEASILPSLAANVLDGKKYYHKNFGDILANAIAAKTRKGGRIALSHCTSYSDDRQVMQFLGDKLAAMNYKIVYCAGDHIKFENKKAFSILDGNEGELDAVFRFTPLEWMLKFKNGWQGYYSTETPSCNHPIAIFAQTKRFPLVWNSLEKLGADLSAWKKLLPKTLDPREAKMEDGFIFKPACGRVGEGITIKGTMPDEEFSKILKDVKKHPKNYIAQKMFESKPLKDDKGQEFHLCLGAYSVNGKAAGFYARISKLARIESNAADIAVLIERGEE